MIKTFTSCTSCFTIASNQTISTVLNHPHTLPISFGEPPNSPHWHLEQMPLTDFLAKNGYRKVAEWLRPFNRNQVRLRSKWTKRAPNQETRYLIEYRIPCPQ